MSGSRNYGVFDARSGRQLAYARAITDGATLAWIADVFERLRDPESWMLRWGEGYASGE